MRLESRAIVSRKAVLRLPGRGAFVLGGCLLGIFLGSILPLDAQPAAAGNKVLQLDGKKNYVQLPPNIFDSLTEATVEGWIKWDRLRRTDRFFDFGFHDREMHL